MQTRRRRTAPTTKRRANATLDVLVAGGGVGGLEVVRNLLEMAKHQPAASSGRRFVRVTVLERKPYWGGRVSTVRTSPTTFYEAGASRFASTHTRLHDVVRTLGLTPQPMVSADGTHATVGRIPEAVLRKHEDLREQFVRKYDASMLRDITWRDVLIEMLGTAKAAELIREWGFASMIGNMNAHDFWRHAVPHYCAPAYYTLPGGMSTLTDALVVRNRELAAAAAADDAVALEMCLGSKLLAMTALANGKFRARWRTKETAAGEAVKMATFDVVFLAMPAEALETVQGLPPPLVAELSSVSRNSLLRCHVQHDPETPVDLSGTNDVIGRATHTHDPRWTQVSYTDHDMAKHMYDMLTTAHGEAFLKDAARDVVDPAAWQKYALRYWKAGTHSWRPKSVADDVYEKVLQPVPGSPLFVVGACFSRAQHWIEGALQTAGDAIHLMRQQVWRRNARGPGHGRLARAPKTERTWTAEMVSDHGHVIFEGGVYDISHIIPTHPGGAKILEGVRGEDITRKFYDVGHTNHAHAWLNEHRVGVLKRK